MKSSSVTIASVFATFSPSNKLSFAIDLRCGGSSPKYFEHFGAGVEFCVPGGIRRPTCEADWEGFNDSCDNLEAPSAAFGTGYSGFVERPPSFMEGLSRFHLVARMRVPLLSRTFDAETFETWL